MLFQLVVCDLSRALAIGWERHVTDELLREDIARCIDGQPERRFGSAAELATRLRQLESRRARLAKQRARRVRRRHTYLVVGSLASLLLVVAATVVHLRERSLRLDAEVAKADADSQRQIVAGRALEEVARLEREARWDEARAVLDQADGLLASGGAPDLRLGLEQARSDLDLVARLDKIRLTKAR
jgi:hypothetical protein